MNRHHRCHHATCIRSLVLAAALAAKSAPLFAQVLVQIPEIRSQVTSVGEMNGTVFFGTGDGIFYSAGDQKTVTKVNGSEGKEFYCITKLRNSGLGIGSEQGVYTIADSELSRKAIKGVDGLPVQFIVEDGAGNIWIAAARKRGNGVLFQRPADSNAFKKVSLPSTNGDEITFMKYFPATDSEKGDLLVGSKRDLFVYRHDSNRFETFKEEPIKSVVDVLRFRNEYYMISHHKGYWLHFHGRKVHGALDIAVVRNGMELWCSINGKVMRVDRELGLLHLSLSGAISKDDITMIAEADKWLLLASKNAVFFSRNNEPEVYDFNILAKKRDRFRFNGVWQSERGTWIWGSSGLSRLYNDINIDIDLKLTESTVMSKYVQGRLQLYYAKNNSAAVIPGAAPIFTTYVDFNRDRFEKNKYTFDKYKPHKEQKFFYLPKEEKDIYIRAVDRFGNIFETRKPLKFNTKTNEFSLTRWLIGAVGFSGIFIVVIFGLSYWNALSEKCRLYLAVTALVMALFHPVLTLYRYMGLTWIWRHYRSLYGLYYCRTYGLEDAEELHPYLESLLPKEGVDIFNRLRKNFTITLPELTKGHRETLEAIRASVVCAKVGPFSMVFPVMISAEHCGSDEDIKEVVVETLRQATPCSSRRICEALVIYSPLIILISYRADNLELKRKILNFFNMYGRADKKPASFLVLAPTKIS